MHIENYESDRKQLLELFALADHSPAQIASYIGLGDVLIARDGCAIVGHLQLIETDDVHVFELKSMAVTEARQGQGIGRRLVEVAIARCRQRKGRKLIVSTAAADTGNLRFYQRQGFRMYRIVRDAFVPATGYAAGT